MVYLISYEINDAVYDYTDLVTAIKNLGPFQHPMNTLWFVCVHNMPASEITNMLRQYLKSRYDVLYVMEVKSTSDKQGWMPNAFWTWLNRNER